VRRERDVVVEMEWEVVEESVVSASWSWAMDVAIVSYYSMPVCIYRDG